MFDVILLLLVLGFIAAMYASVGHGGASGYLAILSLTAYAAHDPAWLKQHAWCLNLLVSAIAFIAYRSAGHHRVNLTVPFLIASIPMAFVGGSLPVDGMVYDALLCMILLLAAWRLQVGDSSIEDIDTKQFVVHLPSALFVGGIFGFASGIIGIGGGIFLTPFLILFKWAPPKEAAATSAAFIWLNSASGLAGAALSPMVGLVIEPSTLALFGSAVLIGGFVGARWGANLATPSLIRKVLTVVLVVASSRLLIAMFVGMG